MLCQKHYNQFKKYGKFLDNNPRTIYDKNEYHIDGDTTYIDLYDKNYNVVAQAIIDTEDLDKVRYTKWKLSGTGYAMNTPKIRGANKHMSRVILGLTEDDVGIYADHINHNRLDNRKANLRRVTRAQNQMNANHRGISRTLSGKYCAYIKINQKCISLGLYDDEDEALFARWYAEVLFFGEYRYPKEQPIIMADREIEITDYVTRRCNDYNYRHCSTNS